MSLVHSLEMASALEPAEAVGVMTHALADASRDENSLRAPGLFAVVTRPRALGQSVVEDDYGFRPTLSVLFEVYPNEDYLGGMRAMMRAAVALLGHDAAAEAVMLFNGERTVLRRAGGELLLNERWDNWKAHAKLLPEVTLPHELRFVPSPALEEHAPAES